MNGPTLRPLDPHRSSNPPAARAPALLALLALMLPLAAAGCQRQSAPAAPAVETRPVVSDDQLLELIDELIDDNYAHRQLNLRDHAAWQVLHGVLAYKEAFLVDDADGRRLRAVDYLLDGGTMIGWTLERGIVLDEPSGRRGLRAVVEPGTRSGQGHYDQWLAILAQCELPPETTIRLDGDEYTIADMVEQVQWDVPRNVDREFSWTIVALTTYLDSGASWTAQDDRRWSIEQLVGYEAEHSFGSGACGGTHRLGGLAMALNRHLAQGGELSGAWVAAEQRVRQGIETARAMQNPDGSFSSNYFDRPGTSPDLTNNLHATGHILEFLALSMSDEQLQEPWVRRATVYLCEVLDATRDVPLDCGALYHALRGLIVYRERIYGPKLSGSWTSRR